MRAESTNEKQRWTKDEVAKLKNLHSAADCEARSHLFFEKLTANFKNRTVASVVEECRRLGLKPKRNPKSDKCTYEDCGADLATADRIGNLCRRCYNRRWYRERLS
jgi:hypothetical protein